MLGKQDERSLANCVRVRNECIPVKGRQTVNHSFINVAWAVKNRYRKKFCQEKHRGNDHKLVEKDIL